MLLKPVRSERGARAATKKMTAAVSESSNDTFELANATFTVGEHADEPPPHAADAASLTAKHLDDSQTATTA